MNAAAIIIVVIAFAATGVLAVRNWLLVAILLGLLTVPALGQNKKLAPQTCRRNLTLAEFLLPEDANAVKDAFSSFRSALLDGDRKKVVEHVRFPLEVILSGSPLRLKDAQDLLGRYDDIFTPFVVSSVRKQDPERLMAGWDGVSVESGAVRFVLENSAYVVGEIILSPLKPTGDAAEFLNKRLTCPPLILEGKVIAFNWASRMPAFENIYIDHFIVDVTKVLSGTLPEGRIRVDFWGVSHLPEYNLPKDAFAAPQVWRMYLRAADDPPQNSEVCDKDVQETVSFVDEETGREVENQSAIAPLDGASGRTMTYAGPPCFEAKKQYFKQQAE